MQCDDLKTPLPSEKIGKKIPQSSKTQQSLWLLATLSLLLAIATAAGAFYVFKTNIEPYLLYPQQARASEKLLLDMQRTIAAQQKSLDSIQKDLKQYQRESNRGDVYLSEAEYLIKLAMFNLSFEGNAAVARQLLQTADEKIQSFGATAGWPIRQALAKDIAALDAVAKVDLPGVVSRLNALSEQVESLPRSVQPTEKLMTAMNQPAQQIIAPSFKQKLEKLGQRITQILASLVIISRDVPQGVLLLPPDQYVYVITNIQSKLSMAAWAVVYHQPDIYMQNLMQARDWVYRYFVDNNNQVTLFLDSLEELMAISVKSDFPDFSNSLKAIEQLKQGESMSSPEETHHLIKL